MTKQTKHEIPKPPNDGRTYKYVAGKHVAVGEKQRPVQPASARRAEREAEAAEQEKAKSSNSKRAKE